MNEYNNNNNDFLCANIFEDQAQWHDKTKGLKLPNPFVCSSPIRLFYVLMCNVLIV